MFEDENGGQFQTLPPILINRPLSRPTGKGTAIGRLPLFVTGHA